MRRLWRRWHRYIWYLGITAGIAGVVLSILAGLDLINWRVAAPFGLVTAIMLGFAGAPPDGPAK